jgi:cytochrome P450
MSLLIKRSSDIYLISMRLYFLIGCDGLVTSGGQVWQYHRHLINPGFHYEALKGMTRLN